jgi:molecular chaperone GrpE
MTDEALEQQPGGAAAEPAPEDARPASDAGAPEAVPPAGGIEALQEELARCQDRLLRTAAEYDNYRRRTDRERRDLADRAIESLLLDLLGVVDDFDRALSPESAGAAGDAVEAYRQGIELIRRRMMEVLARRGVTAIDAVGQDFDPNLHQAVATAPAGERRDGEVVEQFSRGYVMGERLLRPAMVKVART